MKINIEDISNLKAKGVYSITNTLNGKKYIGSTRKSFLTRLKQHCQKLNNNKHHCEHLQNAWNKYGEENFEFSILEIVTNFSELLDKEKYYIQQYNAVEQGYNKNPDPNTSPMYNTNSRNKSSLTHKQWWKSKKEELSESEYKEFCKKYIHSYGKPAWNKGIKMSKEQTAKMHRKKNSITAAMKNVHLQNAQRIKDNSDFILVFDINNTWINTFYCLSDLVEYSKSPNNDLPIVPAKGKERFGKDLNFGKILNHIKSGTVYKGLYFKRVPKSQKCSYANAENSWKADQEPIMSRAKGTPLEGAETSGEVESS